MKTIKVTVVVLSIILLSFNSSFAQSTAQKTLKSSYGKAFKMGVAISPYEISDRNIKSRDLILEQFNAISPGNHMKPESLNPKPGVWNFAPADEYVEFGRKNNMFILGHTLCWHNQTPDHFWFKENGEYKSHDELVETLRSYIETVCTRYAGKVDAWDVVNEIVSEDGGWRNIGWVKAFGGDGAEVVKLAFKFANEYCPKETELYYNEFNVWRPSKLEGVINLVKMLREEGLRIDGVGIQAHWGLNYPKNQYIEDAIDKLSALGVKVMITELDVDVLPISKEGQVIGKSLQDAQYQLEEFEAFLDPYKEGLPAEVEHQLSDRYAELFRIFYNHRDQIDRVTFWGLHDGSSWKNGSPIPRRTNYPLLFKRDYTPHDAFGVVLAIPSAK